MSEDRIQQLREAGMVIPEDLSDEGRRRIASLSDEEFHALIGVSHKISPVGGPEPKLRYGTNGFQTMTYEE